jgi:hypothetical protein
MRGSRQTQALGTVILHAAGIELKAAFVGAS